MKLNSFIQSLNELAFDSGLNSQSNYSRKYDWGSNIKNSNFTKLIAKDIGSQHYRLYRYGTYQFILSRLLQLYKYIKNKENI